MVLKEKSFISTLCNCVGIDIVPWVVFVHVSKIADLENILKHASQWILKLRKFSSEYFYGIMTGTFLMLVYVSALSQVLCIKRHEAKLLILIQARACACTVQVCSQPQPGAPSATFAVFWMVCENIVTCVKAGLIMKLSNNYAWRFYNCWKHCLFSG